MGSIYSDLALRQYALWSEGVLKYAYDSSISGDKLQMYPIRVPQEWLIRNGPRTRYAGVVAVGEPVSPASAPLVIGFIVGWAASKYLG